MNFKLLSVFAALSIFGFAAAEEKLTIEENLAVEQNLAGEENLADLVSEEKSALEENLIHPRCLSPTEKCTNELEAIVYQPESAARTYLDKISEQIKCAGPILWSSQAFGFIQNFEAKYNVKVIIRNPFRGVEYPLTKSFYGQNYMSTTSTANMNGSGFAVDTDSDNRIVYEFIVYNPYGQLKYVTINMPLEDAPPQFIIGK